MYHLTSDLLVSIALLVRYQSMRVGFNSEYVQKETLISSDGVSIRDNNLSLHGDFATYWYGPAWLDQLHAPIVARELALNLPSHRTAPSSLVSEYSSKAEAVMYLIQRSEVY